LPYCTASADPRTGAPVRRTVSSAGGFHRFSACRSACARAFCLRRSSEAHLFAMLLLATPIS